MSRTKRREKAGTRPSTSQQSDTKPAKQGKSSSKEGMRETIESVVVAFVLAFLFRAFEAEAFVIPTGSMAPTLYGRHKDVICEKCGYPCTVGASDEVDDASGYLMPQYRIETALCPNCRFENRVRELPVFKGDRILVTKFPYEFRGPKRWDVAVFKYPEEPKTNYIKRIVGRPGETIVIRRGDLYLRDSEGRLHILRKEDPNKQRVLQLLVYDNDYPETELHQQGWPRRWVSVERAGTKPARAETPIVAGWKETAAGWAEDDEAHAFRLKDAPATDRKLHWLRYRHIVPTPASWRSLAPSTETFATFESTPAEAPAPQLISDLCGYNTYTGGHNGELYRDCYWVGDLTLACRVDIGPSQDQAQFVLELNEGLRAYRVWFDVASGDARLTRVSHWSRDQEDEEVLGTAQTKVHGQGQHRLRFANVDNRLCLWVDKTLVDFGPKAVYDVPATEDPGPQDEDLLPVGIAAQNVQMTVDHLLLQRDIYYRSEYLVGEGYDGYPDTRRESAAEPELHGLLNDPQAWSEAYRSGLNPPAEFVLGDREYLVLGDNSPRSKDSRLWSNNRHAQHRYAVPASALVGKAFFVYWPHARPFLRDGRGIPVTYHRAYTGYGSQKTNYPDFRLPFYPQVTRMHRIR